MADVEAAATGDTLLRLTVALDAARELITVIDATPGDEGGPLIVFANAAYLRETGYSAAEIVGKRVGRLLDGADEGLLWRFREATEAGRAFTLAARARRKDGSTFAYEAEGQPFFRDDGTYAGRIAIGRNVEESNALRDRFASVVAALEYADDNVFVVDQHLDDGSYRVSFANESVVQRTGYTREEFERNSTRILNGPLTDQALRQRALAELRAGRKARIELLLYRKDGSTYWSELSATPIADEAGRYTRFVMIERDVSDQRRRSEELGVLWAAFEHASDSIVVYQRPQAGDKPRIVYVNEATIRNSGFSREELISGSTGVGPQTDHATLVALREALMRGEPLRARLALYRKDGSLYWGEVDGRPVRDASGTMTHWISIERDITAGVERERALAALLEASRSLFGVLDAASLDPAFLAALRSVLDAEAAFVTDRTDPLVLRALNAADVVGDERGRLALALHAPGRDPRVVVVRLRREQPPGSNERTVLALLAQTYAAASRNAASFDEIDQQRAAVLALNRMKGDLITMLANDLNNPLTSIRGFAELLAEEQLDGTEGAIATTAILRATQRLLDLGKETLALARLEDDALVLTPQPIDYGALLGEIARGFAQRVEVAASGEVEGTADPVLVRGLFETLVGNAVKAASPELPVAVRVYADGEAIAIAVEEAGPAELGLFVRLVVQRHGGSTAVEHDRSGATRVVVRMPRYARFAVPRGVLLLQRERGATASYTEHILRDAGYRVRVVHDPAAFARELADDGGVIAIVPDGAPAALAAARERGVPTVELHTPYLARDLLRALASAALSLSLAVGVAQLEEAVHFRLVVEAQRGQVERLGRADDAKLTWRLPGAMPAATALLMRRASLRSSSSMRSEFASSIDRATSHHRARRTLVPARARRRDEDRRDVGRAGVDRLADRRVVGEAAVGEHAHHAVGAADRHRLVDRRQRGRGADRVDVVRGGVGSAGSLPKNAASAARGRARSGEGLAAPVGQVGRADDEGVGAARRSRPAPRSRCARYRFSNRPSRPSRPPAAVSCGSARIIETRARPCLGSASAASRARPARAARSRPARA